MQLASVRIAQAAFSAGELTDFPVLRRKAMNMTMIAQVTTGGLPFLLSDVLVSSRGPHDTEIVLPTRAEITFEARQAMAYVPVRFARKIIEITPRIHAVGAGDFFQIREFAYRAPRPLSVLPSSRPSFGTTTAESPRISRR